MAEADFRLPSSSFPEISKIIQAYAQINRPASLDDVSKRTGINATTISGNNGFLLALAIIEGGKSKAPTPTGKKLGDALGHGLDEEVRTILRQIVEDSEFLKNVLGAVRIRRGMEESALKSHIAYSAGAAKSPSVLTGAGAVIDILSQSGAIQLEDGKYAVPSAVESLPQESGSSSPSVAGPTRSVENNLAFPLSTNSALSLSIEVHIACTPADLDGLGEKLKKIVEQFAGPKDPAQ